MGRMTVDGSGGGTLRRWGWGAGKGRSLAAKGRYNHVNQAQKQ